MPLYATVLDVELVIRRIPNPHPRAFNCGGTVELVGANSLTFHFLANCHPLFDFVLVQHRICSVLAIVTLIVHIT